jgi:hypothetical protein
MLRDMSNGHRAYADAMFQAYRGQPVAGEITPGLFAILSARDFADMRRCCPRDPYGFAQTWRRWRPDVRGLLEAAVFFFDAQTTPMSRLMNVGPVRDHWTRALAAPV